MSGQGAAQGLLWALTCKPGHAPGGLHPGETLAWSSTEWGGKVASSPLSKETSSWDSALAIAWPNASDWVAPSLWQARPCRVTHFLDAVWRTWPRAGQSGQQGHGSSQEGPRGGCCWRGPEPPAVNMAALSLGRSPETVPSTADVSKHFPDQQGRPAPCWWLLLDLNRAAFLPVLLASGFLLCSLFTARHLPI